MKKLKYSLLFSVLLILTLVSVACSSDTEGTANSSDTNQGDDSNNSKNVEKTEIDYWHTYGEQEEAVLFEEIKPAFEEEFPQYELKLTRQPLEGLKQQVIAAVSGGVAPDLMRMDIIWTPEFAALGALAEVSAMKGFDEVKERLYESPMKTNIYEGAYYGVPLNTNTKISVYNKEVLEAAGFSEPPKTMEELEEVAQAAVANDVKGAINVMGVGKTWDFLPYFWSLGGTLTNDDVTQFEGYLNSDESVEAIETLYGWYKDGLISETLLGGRPGTWEGIETGEYLAIDDGPWYFSILGKDQSKPDPLDYTVRGNIPEGEGGSRSVIGGENLVVFKNAENKEGAWTFAKWMTSENAQEIMARGTGLIPTNKDAAQDEQFLELPYANEYVEQLETALPRPTLPGWSEIDRIISLNVEKVFRGELDVQEALDIAAKEADEVLNEE
ncbi:ABC transporter substrate-binding protein [Paraliobacillus quinghaiensis]|uniref:ABC transporter substrate-binding protein n=1 Tax=Paraliobacillus quinghaiensis TaxID=470815 RepID=A0A917TUE4_9BACI|nr:extracellular solute-binding protein [Paraliobacillus quinghaiensis]GGM38721.1 ABC transporter substrate-binding protein [Paraliobacillus quinghaiensis]